MLSKLVSSSETAISPCRIELPKPEFGRLNNASSEPKDSLTDDRYPGPFGAAAEVRIQNGLKALKDDLIRIQVAINGR